MKEFPSYLIPKNKESFSIRKYNRNLAYIRMEIYENMIDGDENNYFDLDKFSRKYNIRKEDLDKMLKDVVDELQNLGWNTKTSFGCTALFIYSTDNPPKSCYDDTF